MEKKGFTGGRFTPDRGRQPVLRVDTGRRGDTKVNGARNRTSSPGVPGRQNLDKDLL